MSFTSVVKNELSKLELDKIEAISELSAILKNSSTISDSIKISTENASIARHIYQLIKEIYNISCKITVRQGYNYNKNYIYILEIFSSLDIIIKDLDLKNNIPDEFLIADDFLKRSYIRGVFIACGSVNDPKKSRYHLELIVDNDKYANFINDLLNSFYLKSKIIKRENRYMIYIKEAEKIGDFLRMINAINALLYYEDIRIYRDHKNMTNRINNCEQANVDKIILSANNLVNDINYIKEKAGLELLDEKTYIAAVYRMKYKEASLTELSEIMSVETNNSITKSGLHHRFNKIKNLANKLRQKELENK